LIVYYSIFAFLAFGGLYGASLREMDSALHSHAKRFLFALAAFILIFIAGFRAATVDRDYLGYEAFFKCVSDRISQSDCQIEPVFVAVSKLSNVLGLGIEGVIFLYAVLSVTVFTTIIYRSETPYLSLLTYFCASFLLHEMTQIRVGLGIAVALWGLDYLYRRERLKYLLTCAIAATIHISCLAFLVLAIFRTDRHQLIHGVLLIFAAIALSFTNLLSPVYKLIFQYFYEVNSSFIAYAPSGGDLSNRFGFIKSGFLALYLVCALNAKRIALYVPKVYIYLNSMLAAICSLYVFYSLPAVSLRFWELFGSVVLFLLPASIYARSARSWRMAAIAGVTAVDGLYLFYFVDYERIVEGYKSILF